VSLSCRLYGRNARVQSTTIAINVLDTVKRRPYVRAPPASRFADPASPTLQWRHSLEALKQDKPLSGAEKNALSVIIGARVKVLKAHAVEQSAARLADFEAKLAAIYSYDQDTVWKAATEIAQKAVAEAQGAVAKRCEELGIPARFAPSVHMSWHGRGENALAERRTELRRVAKSAIAAMERATFTKIERDALDHRTQVVQMGFLSDAAKLFLESLTPIEDVIHALDFTEIEKKLEEQKSKSASVPRFQMIQNY
jgi:hypothetical protein